MIHNLIKGFSRPEGAKYECAICGHIIPTDEEEYAKIGNDHICESCASDANTLLEWIGGTWIL